jgi:hypothetical protein
MSPTSYRDLTQETLKELLFLDVLTGYVYWKPRDRKWFSSDRIHKSWNSSFAGKRAFTTVSVRGYYEGSILDVRTYAHQIVFCMSNGYFPAEIDHINGNKLDNRPPNLRGADRQTQMKNRRRSSNNTSGCTGVVYLRGRNRWLARIVSDGRTTYLGKFREKEHAIVARKQAEKNFNFGPNHDSL